MLDRDDFLRWEVYISIIVDSYLNLQRTMQAGTLPTKPSRHAMYMYVANPGNNAV